jgi:tyrosinase
MTVNLGPVAPTLAEAGIVSTGAGSAYNPRCLRRDISSWVSSQWNTDANSTTLITQNPDIYWFQTVMQGDFANGVYGVHTGGHFTFGGDPGGDIFSSPGDPAYVLSHNPTDSDNRGRLTEIPSFWLHHGQIDRTWWIWQNQDIQNRQNAISGTITLDNEPPSRNGTLEDYLSVGVNAPDLQIKDAMSTLAGPFCYIYI